MKAAKPGGSPAMLVAAGLWLLVAVVTVTTPADPDLWGHLTFGRDILASGHAVQADRYSFTSDQPWVNHEWLSEVCFALLYRTGGAAALVAFKTAITVAMLVLVWFHLRRHGAVARVATLLLFTAFAGTHWRLGTVRPQLFSVLLFTILLLIVAEADRGRRGFLLAVPPMMALWTNLHGGWIVGLGTLGLWTAFGIARRGASAGERLATGAVGVASVAATLLNPYGPGLWLFLWRTVGLQRPDIQEWKPITYSMAVAFPWLLVLAAGGLALWRGGRPRSPAYLAIIAVLGAASVRVSRLDAFFALAIFVLLTPQLVAALPTKPSRASILGPGTLVGTGPLIVTGLACAVMAGAAATTLAPAVRCISMDAAWTPDRDAARFIERNKLHGRMLTWFDWGEYAIWHFGPALRVSYDGRRETVYSDRVIAAHAAFYDGADPGPVDLLSTHPDYVWIPSRLPAARQLESRHWTAIYRSSNSSIFAHTGAGRFEMAPATPAGPRCFPGP